jgi:hypothetical protein
MSWEYSCPQCKVMLNPDRSIILAMHRKDVHILVGFHPQPGKYEVHLPPDVEVKAGSRWDFSCPVCQEELTNKVDPDLCELELRMDDGPLRILFSRVAGEHATFVLNEAALSEKHGKDSARFDLPWGQGKYLV